MKIEFPKMFEELLKDVNHHLQKQLLLKIDIARQYEQDHIKKTGVVNTRSKFALHFLQDIEKTMLKSGNNEDSDLSSSNGTEIDASSSSKAAPGGLGNMLFGGFGGGGLA